MDTVPAVRWKLAATLKQRGVTPYGLVKASGLAQATVYGIAQGKARAVELETLAKLAAGIEKLTGRPAAVADLLEVVAAPEPAPDPPALGAALTPEMVALLERARATLKVRPGRALRPDDTVGLSEPIELEGEGPTGSEIVARMRAESEH